MPAQVIGLTPGPRSGSKAAATTAGAPSEQERLRVMAACRALLAGSARGLEHDDLLRLAARGMCLLLESDRCSVYVRAGDGIFRGRLAVPGREMDDAVRRLTGGGEADRFTQQIVASQSPVFISDAQRDGRPVRATMREWSVRSMLGVPVCIRGEVASIMYIDDKGSQRTYTASDQAVAAAYADIVGVIIDQTETGRATRRRLETASRQLTMLRKGGAVDDRLAALAVQKPDLDTLVETIASMSNRGCQFIGLDGQVIASAGVEPGASIGAALWSSRGEAPATDQPQTDRPVVLKAAGRCVMVVPVLYTGEVLGSFALVDGDRPFDGFDTICVKRGAASAATMLSHARSLARAAAYSDATLIRDLLDEDEAAERVADRASLAGIDVSVPQLIALATTDLNPALFARAYARACHEQRLASPCPAQLRFGTVSGRTCFLLALGDVAEPSARAAEVRDLLDAVARAAGVTVALSGVCRDVHELRAAAQEIEPLLASSTGTGVVSPAPGIDRLLDGLANPSAAGRFAVDVLGDLVLNKDKRSDELLSTLTAFIDARRHVREAADALGVHENTVRYRLDRVTEVTGLNVISNPDHQMTAHLAILALRHGPVGLARRRPCPVG